MIVRMKKVAIFVQSKDTQDALKTLRSLGALHVEHVQTPKGGDIRAIKNDIALIDETLAILPKTDDKNLRQQAEKRDGPDDWHQPAQHIRNLSSRLKQLEGFSRSLSSEIEYWANWGDFDPEEVGSLRGKGVNIGLYQIPKKEISRLPEGVVVKEFFTSAGFVNCALVFRGETDIPFKEIRLPGHSLSFMRGHLAEDRKVIQNLRGDLDEQVKYRPYFLRKRRELEHRLEFNEARRGMGEEGGIGYITGYVPGDLTERLRAAAEKEKWGTYITDPREDDNVPTLIRNPKWVDIIKPVFRIIQTFPAYREVDISLWFLIFFSIFYGVLIGDAGYGFVFFVLTLFGHAKLGKKTADKSPFFLMYLLSTCAVLWGAGSGTFFGQAWLPSSIKPLIPALRDSRSIQLFCFTLGAVHLSIAHVWRGIRRLPSIEALSEAGWICLLWGAYLLAKMLILGDVFPSFGTGILIAGGALIILFTRPSKNILKGIGSGLGALLLNMINCFTDIVSYIRLFAVGTATVAVADAFNQMAFGIGFGSVIAGFATSLILFLGHALNIILGVMAILVHGVRLNMLEFSGHLNMEWSGTPYTPFRDEKGENSQQ